MDTDIQINELVNGSIVGNSDGGYKWQGTGIFDKLMEAVNGNIKVEFDSGRIVGKEYATVYLGAIQNVIAQSVQYTLQEKQIEAQIELTKAQTEEIDSKKLIAENQSTKDLLLKDQQIIKLEKEIPIELLKIQTGSWTTIYNNGKADNVPDLLTNIAIQNMYNEVKG